MSVCLLELYSCVCLLGLVPTTLPGRFAECVQNCRVHRFCQSGHGKSLCILCLLGIASGPHGNNAHA